MSRRLARAALAFAALVAAMEGLHTALAWWRGELETVGLVDGLLLAALALGAIGWWRVSVFAQPAPRCLIADSPEPREAKEHGIAPHEKGTR